MCFVYFCFCFFCFLLVRVCRALYLFETIRANQNDDKFNDPGWKLGKFSFLENRSVEISKYLKNGRPNHKIFTDHNLFEIAPAPELLFTWGVSALRVIAPAPELLFSWEFQL